MAYKNTNKTSPRRVSNNFLFGSKEKREASKSLTNNGLLSHLPEKQREQIINQGKAIREHAVWGWYRQSERKGRTVPVIEATELAAYLPSQRISISDLPYEEQ